MATCYRAAVLEAGSDTEAAAGIVSLSFASESPVLRDEEGGKYFEVLSHAPGDANLGTLNRAGVLLEGHDDKKEIGEVVPGSARVDPDRKTRAKVKVTDPTWRNRIAAGDLPKGVSVGYVQIAVVSRTDGPIPTLRFSWRPYECSFLRDDQPAADPSVGINRSRPSNMTNSNTLDRLLELALSGSRASEGRYTREQCNREFSLLDICRGAPAGITREIASTEHTFGPYSPPGSFVPFGALLPRRRDFTAGDGLQSGGAFVATDLHPAIELLRNHVCAVPLGARVFPGLRGNFALPRITSAVAPQSLSEIAQAALSQFTVEQPGFAPCRATVEVLVSAQLFRQTGDGAEDVIRSEIASQVGVVVDRLVLQGQGAGDEPLGIMNTVGVGSVVYGGPATWPQILASESSLAAANADFTSRLGWAISPATRARWKNIPRIAGSTTPSFIMEGDQTVNGYRSISTNQLSGNHQSVFGNFSDCLILVWGEGLDFTVERCSQAQSGKIAITATLFFNVLVRHPQSFCVSADPANQ